MKNNFEETSHHLDEYGKLIFRSKENPYMFAMRSYHWKDRAILIDESFDKEEKRHCRRVVADVKFSEMDLSGWEPMKIEQYNYLRWTAKSYFYEVYPETNPIYALSSMFSNLPLEK